MVEPVKNRSTLRAIARSESGEDSMQNRPPTVERVFSIRRPLQHRERSRLSRPLVGRGRREPSRAKAAAVSVLTLAATLTGAAVAPTAAVADDGDRRQTVSCESLWVNDAAGVTHARLRDCTVTWGKNILDGSYWQTVKFQLLDSRTDGVCAKARAISSETGASTLSSECNGDWTTKTANLSGRTTNIFIRIAYGTNSTYGNVYTNVTPPSGF
jgi:hypothetical protein